MLTFWTQGCLQVASLTLLLMLGRSIQHAEDTSQASVTNLPLCPCEISGSILTFLMLHEQWFLWGDILPSSRCYQVGRDRNSYPRRRHGKWSTVRVMVEVHIVVTYVWHGTALSIMSTHRIIYVESSLATSTIPSLESWFQAPYFPRYCARDAQTSSINDL